MVTNMPGTQAACSRRVRYQHTESQARMILANGPIHKSDRFAPQQAHHGVRTNDFATSVGKSSGQVLQDAANELRHPWRDDFACF